MVGRLMAAKAKKICVFRFEGYVEETVGKELKARYKNEWDQGTRQYLFDFSKTTLINSIALSELLEIVSDSIGEPEVMLYISQIPEKCYWGLSSLGLLHHMTEFTSFEQAARELGLNNEE